MDPVRWERVKRIAADALERDAERRGAFVHTAAGGDAALEAEVLRILAADAGADSLLDEGPPASALAALAFTPGSTAARAHGPATDGETPWPQELIERGARRLGTLALIYAAGFLLAYTIYELNVHVAGGAAYVQRPHTPGQLLAATFILFASAVAWIALRRTWPPQRVVRLAYAFEVAGSFGIALVSYSGVWQLENPVWGVSWVSVWIILFPMVIPGPPRQAALAAFGAAAMGPAALLIWGATRDFVFPETSIVLATTLPNFMCAALAWLGSRYLYRIGLELRAARQLGRYRLVERIGAGGMGEVWRAEHDMLARPAALKLVRPELMRRSGISSEALARFEREAQSTAALSSPHTVTLYDFGVTDDDLFYYAMELLDGLDLDTLIRRHGKVPPARAIHFMTQACASLAEAHARGLVHRDIKPSNLFACRQGLQYDFLKVLDFGIVKPRTERTSAAGEVEAGAQLEGTPGWIAPEAAALGVADARTDLYALGCVGYWLVSGRPVFGGGHGDELQRRHRDESPTPPSLLAPDLPPALDRAILACLEKDPARRPAAAAELAMRLAAVPIEPWTAELARAWWETIEARHPPAAMVEG